MFVSLEGTETALVEASDPGKRIPTITIGGLADAEPDGQRNLRDSL